MNRPRLAKKAMNAVPWTVQGASGSVTGFGKIMCCKPEVMESNASSSGMVRRSAAEPAYLYRGLSVSWRRWPDPGR
jgi:hypothetical protein